MIKPLDFLKNLKTSNSTTFRLTGGIGNQLFIFAAGQYYSNRNKVKVKFDISDKFIEKNIHKSDIRNLNIENLKVSNKRKYLYYIIRKFPILVNKFYFDSSTYYSESVGFDSHLNTIIDKHKVKGYFQSYIYVSEPSVKNLIENLELSTKSSKLESDLNGTNLNKSLAVHIRRGDYKENSQTHGLLGAKYFENGIKFCINHRSTTDPIEEVLVFSDNADDALTIFQNIELDLPVKFLGRSNYSDEETLVLMSRIPSIVISNSTFSWWAAWTNNFDKLIVAPSKWFKGMPDPEFLIPNDWIRLNSHWE